MDKTFASMMSSAQGTPANAEHLNIHFKSGDKEHCYELGTSTVINVTGSTGNHDHGSSKIKLKSVVDYKWEIKNYPGRLIAIHMNGDFIAYAIKVSNKPTGTEGMVRVVSNVSSERALLKGMSDEVLDLQFAHLQNKVLLACIEATALHIHTITSTPAGIKCDPVLKIHDPIIGHVPQFDSISWCPFVKDNSNREDEEDEEDEKNAGHSIVWTRGSTFQCYCVSLVTQQYGEGSYDGEKIVDGCIKFNDQSALITCAKYSPDGSTLAVSSVDGYIRCYQIYFFNKSPRRLHEWVPHNNKPVTSFFFLDNLSSVSYSGNNLWKYCVTFAENNTELKLWSCELWKCLQTITFQSESGAPCQFKVELDRTSSYLVLSDQKNRGVYVLQIIKSDLPATPKVSDDENDLDGEVTKIQDNQSLVYIKSIAEFPISSPILSFGIENAAVRKYKCGHPDDFILNDLDDFDEESSAMYCVAIQMYIVQPKSVYKCHLLYQPTVPRNATVIINQSVNDLSTHIKQPTNQPSDNGNEVQTVSVVPLEQMQPKINTPTQTNGQLVKPQTHINLMTPEAFNSPGKQTNEGVSTQVMATLRMLAQVTTTSNNNTNLNTIPPPVEVSTKTPVNEMHLSKTADDVEMQLAQAAEALDNLQPSGGSSPSREVCEILSDCLNENDFYESSPVELDDVEDEDDNDEAYPIVTDEMINSIADAMHVNKKLSDDLDCINDMMNIPAKVTSSSIASNRSDDPWPKVPNVPPLCAATPIAQLMVEPLPASNTINSQQLNEMNAKLDQMIGLLQAQNFEIADLRSQVVQLEKSRTADNTEINKFAHNIEMRLSKMLGEYLIRYEREHSKNDTQNRELHESIVHTINQVLCTELNTRLSGIVMTAFKVHVLPLIGPKMDAIKQQVQTEVAKKLTSSDKVICESLSRLCTSKEIADRFGSSVTIGVRDGLRDVFQDALKNLLVPNFEKSIKDMLRQINSTITSNLINHASTIENHLSQYKPIQDRSEEIIVYLSQINESQKSNYEAMITSCAVHLSREINKDLKALQTNMNKAVRDSIRNEMQKGFESQAASLEDSVMSAVRSQTQTPAPSVYDVQEQIKQFLAQGQMNKAFHQALLANDLALVEFALERGDINAVFHPTCQLEQTVLLSLVQQITADMSTFNEIKLKYLFEAILCLDLRDPITKEHAPKVVRELHTNCQNFIASTDNAYLGSSLRMALLSIRGMGLKLF